jgi:glycosyltransferase involved in cell wall biosynthesis
MNVLLIDQFSELGGAQRCMLDLVIAMHKLGWEPRVALPSNGPLAERLKEHHTPVDIIACGPYRSGRKTSADMLRFALDTVRSWRKIAELTTLHRADLVYVNGPRPLPAAALAARDRASLLFHVHSHLSLPYAQRLAGWAVRDSNATVISSCEFLAEPLRAYVRPDRLHIVYNGTSEIPFIGRPVPENGAWRIGVVGRIAPEKGQDQFLRAARIVSHEFPACRFVICGASMFSDPEFHRSVLTLADGLPVDFLGWREDIAEVLSTLHLLIVPSAPVDGTTRVILEAYSAGVPVVAYPSGGIREVIRKGSTGFLADSNDPKSLAATLLAVMRAPGRLADVAIEARKAWEKKYTVDRYCHQVLEVIESAVRPSNTRNRRAAETATSAAIPSTEE